MKTMKMLKDGIMQFVCSLGILMLTGMVWSGSVYAEVKTTTYPGTMCQPYSPTTANNVRYNTQGVYNNSTTQTATVKCPIPFTLPGGKLSSVIVDVKDYSFSATITCQAYIRKLDGESVHMVSANSDQYFGGNSDVFMTNINYGGNGGDAVFYNLSCGLPKKLSGIPQFAVVGYHVTETN